MSTKLYDDALVEKISNWTKNTVLNIVGPEETRRLFEVIGDKTNDKPIQLPLISIRRNGGYSIQDFSIGKQPMSFDGLTLNANHKQASQLNSIAINLTYQIDVYARYFEEADEYVRNLVFNIINFPKLTINIPYNNENYKHVANLVLNSDITDNSDIPERLVAGQFTRLTLTVNIDDARLWDVRYRDVYTICTSVYTCDDKDKDMDSPCKPVCPMDDLNEPVQQ